MLVKQIAKSIGVGLFGVAFYSQCYGEIVGEVATTFKLLGANDKIVIEAFDDPDVSGVTCYLSRAKKGGVSGSLGLAEDTSDASIACRQVGPIKLSDELKAGKLDGEQVFKKRTSVLFKTMQVVRFFDPKRQVIIYLTYSDKLVEGSPKNSVTAVPVLPWPEGAQ
ncbi:CreA family protein [Endozoicomonas sp. SM1973]|uniref:CreA family protein n=1 Tax=Spartinivicinus marinus TaxID=2994442 RepID=A0A853I632_9GAMM|nr:CreA family protein [Spartinivicinus marinus]MCX4029015.1 CreA family protein [Spartinivicinus marinus]NYZ65401.1 CreA family protein [Spartinivicinus marinus]